MDVFHKALSFTVLAFLAVGISSTLAVGARTVFGAPQTVQTAETTQAVR
jgi:hypothetical protein